MTLYFNLSMTVVLSALILTCFFSPKYNVLQSEASGGSSQTAIQVKKYICNCMTHYGTLCA